MKTEDFSADLFRNFRDIGVSGNPRDFRLHRAKAWNPHDCFPLTPRAGVIDGRIYTERVNHALYSKAPLVLR